MIKYFCESEKPFKIICAGSLLGVKIKRFYSSFPVGKVKMEYMYPMDFEEFLMATSSHGLIDEIYKCYNSSIPMTSTLHEKLMGLYRMYLCVGGMPQAVQNIVDVNQNIFDFDKDIIKNIIESYLNDMNQYEISDVAEKGMDGIKEDRMSEAKKRLMENKQKSAKASKDKYEQGLNDYYKNHGINKTKVDNTNYIDLSKNDDDAR